MYLLRIIRWMYGAKDMVLLLAGPEYNYLFLRFLCVSIWHIFLSYGSMGRKVEKFSMAVIDFERGASN